MQFNERGALIQGVGSGWRGPPPWLYSWSPCGSRLAMLSSTADNQCAVSAKREAAHVGPSLPDRAGYTRAVLCVWKV